MKKLIAAAMIAAVAVPPISIRAEPAGGVGDHGLVESYIESDNAPVLMDTTAYIHGGTCSHGDRARKGIAAIAPEWYGSAVVVYEAVKSDDGYEVGDMICILEGLDTGYGKSTGDGVPSRIRTDKGSRGTIEAGKSVDVYCETRKEAIEWMELTSGRVMVQIIRDAKG